MLLHSAIYLLFLIYFSLPTSFLICAFSFLFYLPLKLLDPSFFFEAEMKKIEYARNRSTGRNWAYHKKEEMYLKKLEMKKSMTEFLNRVKKVETPPMHFIYSNEVEEGSEEVRMKLAEKYEDHSYLFNYGAVINEDDIVEMERRKKFNQKRPHTRSSTLKSDNSNNELNSKINLYFLHQNCGNCIRLRVNGTLVPEYFVRRSAFPNRLIRHWRDRSIIDLLTPETK